MQRNMMTRGQVQIVERTDLAPDHEWDLLQPLVAELDKGRSRPPKHDRREMLDAMFYVVRGGCSWRWLPAHYPPWQPGYAAFRDWSDRDWVQ